MHRVIGFRMLGDGPMKPTFNNKQAITWNRFYRDCDFGRQIFN